MGRMELLSKIVNTAGNQCEGFCIVKSVTVKNNVKGADYLDMILADRGGEISAKLWDYDAASHGSYYPDMVVKVRGTITQWKDSEQLKIDRIRKLKPDEQVDMSILVPCAPIDPEEVFGKLWRTAEDFCDGDLKMLTQYLLREKKAELIKYPAALKLHHAQRGGLMFHTVTMLEAAGAICDIYEKLYPSLSRELVYTGVILHDVAKTVELTVGELGVATAYSPEGQLIGHINTGVAMVERAAAELMIEDETRMLVEHMLLSHHGIPEYGSPRAPMFPEAEIVSQVDVLDSKMFEMFDALSGVQIGEFTERQWALDNRQLYRHGHKEKHS